MDTRKLAQSLKKGNPASLYLIAGEEGALVDRALDILSSKILSGKGSDDFSYSRFDGRTASATEIEAAARTASLFGGHRLVILREAHLLRAAEQKKLLVYLKKPVPTTTLVLVVRGAGPSSRGPRQAKASKAARAFQKAVEKGGGQVVDCPRPRARDLPKLAEQLLGDQGCSADRDGLYALVEAVGEDLGALMQAVDKLALFKGGEGRIDSKDVREVVADTRSESVFDLTDAAAEGDLTRALGVLRRMLRDGEAPLPILGHLTRHFRNLATVQALARRGRSADDIRAALGLHPYVVKKCTQQSRRFGSGRLAAAIESLAKADQGLKGGRIPDELICERLLFALCGQTDS
ncbi:MAG: DNA polymerase III subunit delta [Deltaproteobacteria bacterium]|nr:DNA polymerase III subunit delta [Deltaproteobacteria bacterium]